jgi:hypothetical protein
MQKKVCSGVFLGFFVFGCISVTTRFLFFFGKRISRVEKMDMLLCPNFDFTSQVYQNDPLERMTYFFSKTPLF